ncbi:hypothetical protein HYPSUDRAFT_152296 [Hypholoma sublateritium FD-334 SS-4]|uniref:Uncharacterized protein n=1 Tax=Hypholoma sublateritium (strain FD-334 SS-4) TaxID=945553 RepID=A0A0D2LPK7_HYPSF|nr:hypothetical protein HYPSUDRAFT_152296 [Hypholoma sublateritium FD-334 SS-4]
MWDDSSALWSGSSYLVINNYPVPIVYWKQVYTAKYAGSWKVNNWRSMKGKFFEFKASYYIHAMRRYPSMNAFWNHFSDGGEHLGYTAILNRLADERSAENNRIVQLARDEYGDSFSSTFGYRRRGLWVSKTKAVDIAKQYRSIHKLADPFDDEYD